MSHVSYDTLKIELDRLDHVSMIAQEHAFSLGATRKKLTTYCQIVQVYFLNTSFLIRWLYRDIGNILPRIALCYMLHKISPVWTHRIARFINAWSPSRHIYHWGNFNDAWYKVLDIYVDSGLRKLLKFKGFSQQPLP